MRAMVLNEPGKLVAADVTLPVRKRHEAMINVTHGGICGTDLKIYEGGNSDPLSAYYGP